MTDHTQEPWIHVHANSFLIEASDKLVAASMYAETQESVPREEAYANARRIVACVNACAGVSTEALEDTVTLARFRGWWLGHD